MATQWSTFLAMRIKYVRFVFFIGATCACYFLLRVFNAKNDNFLVLTVATEQTTSLERFRRSAEMNGLPLKILGLGEDWWLEGFQQKVRILRKELEKHKDDEKIILFADAYDVLFNGGIERILDKFRQFNARVLISADENCHPDSSLCSKGKRFLNAGVFIGYAPELYRMFNNSAYPLTDDEQLHLTRIYVDHAMRHQLRIQIDHSCQLFQTFNGGENNVRLRYQGEDVSLTNMDYGTEPLIVHTPAHCKLLANLMANFIPKMRSGEKQKCVSCSKKEKVSPKVIVSVIIKNFSKGILEELLNLDYPRDKIHLILHNELKQMEEALEAFARSHAQQYAAFRTVYHYETNTTGVSSNDLQMKDCIMGRCTHYLKIDAATRLDDPQMLRMLIERNPVALAPMLYGHDKEAPKFFEFSYANGRCLNSIEVVGSNHVIKVGMF